MKKKKKNSRKKGRQSKETALWGVFFDKLLQKALLPIVVTDRKGKIIFANSSYRRYFSPSKATLVGKNWIDDFIAESERPAIHKIFDNLQDKGVSCSKFDVPLRIGSERAKRLQWISILLKKDRETFLMSVGRPAPALRIKSTKSALNTYKEKATYAEAIAMIFVISKVIDPNTAEHSARATSFAVDFAKELRMPKKSVERLKVASYLHDIGKLAISEKILNKRGPLTENEFERVKKHTIKGVEMMEPICFLKDVISVILNHHENWDGSGYPQGLKGRQIPLEARILSIVDVYEALTSDRPYRKAFSKKEAVAIMRAEKARKFDPELIDIFLDMLEKKKLKRQGLE